MTTLNIPMQTDSTNIRQYHQDSWNAGKNRYSQYGDELIVEYLFKYLPIKHKFCIEFGAKDGSWFSNTKKLRDQGWSSLMMDGEPTNPEVKKEFITRENIVDIFKKYNVVRDPDFLSVDIDGNDIYVCDRILDEYEPTLIVIETNQVFPLGVSKAISYDPKFTFGYDIYYGASVTAMDKMLAKHNYIGIYLCAINLFAIPAKYYYLVRQHILPVSYTVTACFPITKRISNFINYPPDEKSSELSYFPTTKTSRRNFHKYPSKYLIESGTYLGGGIEEALSCGFEKVISYEVEPRLYEKAQEKFRGNEKVQLVFSSSVNMGKELKNIRNTITFWLDGHYSAGETGKDEKNFYPLLQELGVIKNHIIRDHTIMIDDRRLMKHSEINSPDTIGYDEKEVIEKIMEINPNYRIKYENGHIPNDIIVAYLPYISVHLCGGLGNQIFQILAVLSLSIDLGMKPVFEKVDKMEPSGTGIIRPTYWDNVFRSLPQLESERYKYIDFNVVKENDNVDRDKHTLLGGYFQDLKFFDHNWQYLKNVLHLPIMSDELDKIKKGYENTKNVVSIHVRRQDYVELANVHYNLPIEYYKTATSKFDVNSDLFLIFSDDLPWCKENITWLKNKYFVVLNDIYSLALMKECSHHIIANSSFSYIGSYICENPDKKVIAPNRWFVNDVMNERIKSGLYNKKYIEVV